MSDHGLLNHTAYALQLSLGLVLVLSFWSKIRNFSLVEEVVGQYEIIPARFARVAATVLTVVEACLGIALITGIGAVFALSLTALLFAVFAGAVAVNLRRGRDVPCGCFGNSDERISSRTLMRLVLLLSAVTTLAVVMNSGGSLTTITELFDEGAMSIVYVLQIASLASFALLAGMWILSTPEVFRMFGSVTAPGESSDRRREVV